jgi:hypothetical protein
MSHDYEALYSKDNVRKHMTRDAARFADGKERLLWVCDTIYGEAMMLRAYVRHHARSGSPVFIIRKHTLCVRVLVAFELLESTMELCVSGLSSEIKVFAEQLAQLHRILRLNENYDSWAKAVDALPFAFAALVKMISPGGPWPKYALDAEQCTIAFELVLRVNNTHYGMDVDPLEVANWVGHFLKQRKELGRV